MTQRILNGDIKFEQGKAYRIKTKNGQRDRYRVLAIHNPSVGQASIKTVNLTFGWSMYIPLREIETIE